MSRNRKRTAPQVTCPKCSKPGSIHAYTEITRPNYPHIIVRHRNSPKIESCYLRQSEFPEIYQAFFPILLSPRMERIMEATRPK